jgi:endonuclease/exonuclease/phosphatase family metal-dependent hydrolase
MRIHQAPALQAPTSRAAAPRAGAAAPGTAQDTYQPADVKVITFNTAVGNPRIKTRQADFLQLPFYQKALQGAPDAPILCLQEVGNAQRDAVLAQAKGGRFTAIPMRVGARGRQHNMLVIPKRYEVLSHDNDFFKGSHLKGVLQLGWRVLKRGFRDRPSLDHLSQLWEPRGYQHVKLRDTVTGKTFTVFNTHTSFLDEVKVNHVRDLMDAARAARKQGPVIVAGDLNTRTADTDKHPAGFDAKAREALAGFQDMGPAGAPPKHTNIDWVLADGFEGVSSKWYTGESISLPGSPDALTVSDHYAEEDVLRFG